VKTNPTNTAPNPSLNSDPTGTARFYVSSPGIPVFAQHSAAGRAGYLLSLGRMTCSRTKALRILVTQRTVHFRLPGNANFNGLLAGAAPSTLHQNHHVSRPTIRPRLLVGNHIAFRKRTSISVHLAGHANPFALPSTPGAAKGNFKPRPGLTRRSTRTQPAPAGSSNNLPESFAPAKILLPAGPVSYVR